MNCRFIRQASPIFRKVERSNPRPPQRDAPSLHRKNNRVSHLVEGVSPLYRRLSTIEISRSSASFIIARFPSALAPTQNGALRSKTKSRTCRLAGS